MDSASVAQTILDFPGEAALDVLSLAPGLPPVTAETPVADARRNYMRLAAMVHPDKLKDRFEKATEAFQKLVHAFEVLADPQKRKKLLAKHAQAMKKRSKMEQRATRPRSTKMLVENSPATKKPSRAESVAVKSASAKPQRKKTPPAPKPKRSKKKKSPTTAPDASDDEDDFIDDDEDTADTDDEREEESEEESEEEESGGSEAGGGEPPVSASRAPIGRPRTGARHCHRSVGCPRCRAAWLPDAPPHYSLFMGPAGKRVHCQLCLLRFGCATARHACPHCQGAFDYDVSMYDKMVKCAHCGKTFGFPYYPVSQQMIDQVRLEEWRESQGAKKANEREQRAALRHRGSHSKPNDQSDSEEFKMLLGQCIIDEQCPFCSKRLSRSHSAHLKSCMENKKKTNKQAATSKTSRKPTASQKPAAVKGKQLKTKNDKKKAPRKRRRSDSSDSEDEFISSNDDFDD